MCSGSQIRNLQCWSTLSDMSEPYKGLNSLILYKISDQQQNFRPSNCLVETLFCLAETQSCLAETQSCLTETLFRIAETLFALLKLGSYFKQWSHDSVHFSYVQSHWAQLTCIHLDHTIF